MKEALKLLDEIIEFSITQDVFNPDISLGGVHNAESFMTFHLKVLREMLLEECSRKKDD